MNGDGYSDVIVGCPSGGTGKVQLLFGAPASISSAYVWTYAGSASANDLGDAMANADVNGDGYSDLIVGARNFNGGSQPGLTYIFNGSVTGLSTTPAMTLTSPSIDGEFGTSVANAGDVNGDGYEDVIVGCPYCANGQSGEGMAYVYYGAAGGVTNTPAWTMESNLANANFGMAVAGVDVNGDGFSDVAIGAPSYTNVEPREGAIYVYLGSLTGLAQTPIAILEPNVAGSEMGTSVASGGDVNGDGYGDIISGSPEASSRAGKAWVYLGKSTGINAAASWSYVPAWPGQSFPQFGRTVASAGDVNRDGYDDVMVGAYNFSGDQPIDGRVFVWLGSTTGLNSAVAWISQGDHRGDTVGYAMANVGDLNGDGFGDVATGSPWDSYDDNSNGLISDFLGGPGGLGQSTDSWSFVPYDFVGDNVASAGDVNGDGFGDMVISAGGHNLYLYYGNTRDGAMPPPGAAAIARRPGVSIPIPPGGKPATRAFDVRLMARSPHGRTRVKVAVEAKPFGTLFDGTGLVKSTTWLDTGLSRVAATTSLTGLAAAKRYHWRARVEYDRSLATDALWSHWYYGGVSGRSHGNHLRMP